jgi:hypothetical protein
MSEDSTFTEDGAPTPGEMYIGTFNPQERQDVALLKQKAAELIDIIFYLPSKDGRRKSIAITHIEEAAMMAVKALFNPIETRKAPEKQENYEEAEK